MMSTRGRTFGIAAILGLICTVAGFSIHYYATPDYSYGWTPDNVIKVPFQTSNSLIARLPEDFELALIEPDPLEPITMRPSESRRFSARIQGPSATNKIIERPPANVNLKLYRGEKLISVYPLKPSALTNEGHVYSGRFAAPSSKGSYLLFVEAEYNLCDEGIGMLPVRETFRKQDEGTTLHVR